MAIAALVVRFERTGRRALRCILQLARVLVTCLSKEREESRVTPRIRIDLTRGTITPAKISLGSEQAVVLTTWLF